MSKLALVMVMMLMAGRINAQNYPALNNESLTWYFVLIQTDDGQPFYVRLNNQLYSSSAAGHLILSQLKDSVYTITVGFPGHTFAEQRYLINIHQKDRALHLTRQGNQWGLYEEKGQALATVDDSTTTERPPLAGVKKDDPFSQMMSAIVQDTAVMYNTYAAASPDTPHSASPAPAATQSASSSPAATQSASSLPDTSTTTLVSSRAGIPAFSAVVPTSTAVIPPASSAVVPSSPTGVVKLSERRSTKSLSLVFTDHPTDKRTDTIDVLIPVESGPLPPRKPKPDTTHSIDPSFGQGQNSSPDTLAAAGTTPGKPAIPFVNSDCHAFATEYDVDKLRVHMLGAAKDDDRIQTAYKIFKTKCFTTIQIRALSELFTTDPAKFKFLTTAYPFVSDNNFADLANLLSDPVYIDKFRTMTTPH